MAACIIQPDGTVRCDPPEPVICRPPEVRLCQPNGSSFNCGCFIVPQRLCTAEVGFTGAGTDPVLKVDPGCDGAGLEVALAVALARLLQGQAPLPR